MAEMPTLSLVIPCYNEQDNLRALIAAIHESVGRSNNYFQ
jgi:glycosyltransferase involved in cell wall biosynthesis